MSMRQRPDVPALLASRICHDLISPIGAIANGLELMEMGGTPDGPEFQLIQDSVRNANGKLLFFRLAFGTASPGQSQTADGLKELLRAYFADTRIAVSPSLTGPMLRTDARLALLAVLCLQGALPAGGTIALDFDSRAWALHAEGPRVQISPHWQIVTNGAPADVQPADVHFVLLKDAAERAGQVLVIDLKDNRITITF